MDIFKTKRLPRWKPLVFGDLLVLVTPFTIDSYVQDVAEVNHIDTLILTNG